MLRRRFARLARVEDVDEDKATPKKAPAPTFRVLLATWLSTVWSSMFPTAEIQSAEYNRYLTSQVKRLTFGWHAFRALTESAFLAGAGLGADTVVVQVFAAMSWASVLLHTFAHDTWLKWRESMCVYTNRIYALVTILKIFYLIPRLPNENLFLFKFCFLTMADAAFSQTPVHRQWVAQVADAFIRVVVWRRYNVLPDQPLWAILAVSLAWQLWLLTFASLLQANHVRAFMRQLRGPSASASAPSTSAAAAPSSSASAPGPSSSALRAPESDPPSGIWTAAASAFASRNTVEIETDTKREQDAHSNGCAARVQGPAHMDGTAAPTTTSARQSRSPGSTRASPTAAAAAAAAGTARSASTQRYMRALRALARGPSSYVLLSQQRKQSGVQMATAQLYVSSANPEMLLHDWRERLGAAIAEGAPGWHVANACVRKGSLIVHLDLVYVPPGATYQAAAAEAAAARAAAVTTTASNSVTLNPMQHIPYTPFALYTDSTGVPDENVTRGLGIGSKDGLCGRTAAVPSEDSTPEVAALDSYMSGMGAEQLMALLGLEPGLEGTGGAGAEAGVGAVAPVQLQRGDRVMELRKAAMGVAGGEAKAGEPERGAAASVGKAVMQQPSQPDAQPAAQGDVDQQQLGKREEGDKQVTVAARAGNTTPGTPSTSQPPSCSAGPPPHPSPLLAGVRALTHPHPALSTPEYTAFLHSRTSGLHAAYTSLMCTVAVAFAAFHPASGLRMSCLLLYLAAELLSTAAQLLLRPGMWARTRVGCVHVGLVLRTAQIMGHVYGWIPQLHPVRQERGWEPEEDCVSGRWISKTLVLSALQALCMQCPVRPLFALRLPSVLLIMHVHATLCRTSMSLAALAALHLGWEGCMLLVAAWVQQRHLDAFLKQRRDGKEQSLWDSTVADKGCATAVAAEAGGEATAEAAAAPVTGPAPCMASPPAPNKGDGHADLAQLLRAATRGLGSGEGMEGLSPFNAQAVLDASRGPWSVVHPPLPDPTAVALDRRVVKLAPRRAAHLQLSFSAAPAVVDDLSVVLRHVHPASMASGVHAAHAVRDIVRSLVTPAAAAAAPRHVPLPFTADLTLVAAAVDVPGVAYVELWRGRRRVASLPALLVASPATSNTASAGTDGSDASTAAWIQEVAAYIATLESDGHVTAAEQYVEESGAWLAQVAAVQLGMVGGKGPNVGLVTPRIANFLYFHGSGTEYMFIKPPAESAGFPPSGSPRGPPPKASPAAAPAPAAAAGDDPHRDGLRAVLLSQGGMLLAVAVEAGCLALSRHVMGLMRGPLGAGLGAVLQGARTPVTQLPLLHAAVKSGCVDVVDLVVTWLREAGVEDMWAHEAAVLALGLASPAPTVTHGGGSADPSNPATGASTRSSVILLHQVINTRIAKAAAAVAGAAPIVRPSAFGLKQQHHLDHRSHQQQGPMLLSPEPSAGSSVVHAGSNNTVMTPQQNHSRASYIGLEGSETSAAGVLGSFQLGSDIEGAAGQQGEHGGGGGRPLDQSASPDGTAHAGCGIEPQARSDEIEEPLVEGSDGPFRIVSFRAAVLGKRGSMGAAAGDRVENADDGNGGVPGKPDTAVGSHRPGAEEADKAIQMPREELKPHRGPGTTAAPAAASEQVASCAAAAPARRSLELYDGGVLVLTPLHLCMALGDGGRLAAHVLHTYPEANELWRQSVGEPTLHDMHGSQLPIHQQHQQQGQQHHAVPSVLLPAETSGQLAQERGSSGEANADSDDCQPAPQSACGGADHGSGPYDFAGVSEDSSHVATTSWCLPSTQTGVNTSLHLSYPPDGSAGGLELPPCVHEHGQQGALPYISAQGGKGPAGQGLEDGCSGIHGEVGEGASAGAPRSLTLSDVAYLEGFRWVDEGAGSRRPGAHIARLVQ